MHVLYVHQNFPAQFGHIARHLVKNLGWQCTFVSETPGGIVEGIEKIQYKTLGGATAQTHFCSRTFENAVWHSDAVYRALRDRRDIRPDLIVGHSGFGSTIFLPELYPGVPIVNFFEFFYRAHDADSDMDFRKDLGWEMSELKYLRARTRNAMILSDLHNCQAAYIPTEFQRSRFPEAAREKLQVIFDGVDRSVYHGFGEALRPSPAERGMRTIAGIEVGPSTRVVTYVSRGFESMRGFDIFMRAAKLIARRYPDVVFIIVGTDRIAYGGDEDHLGEHKSFKQWVLGREEFDLYKFKFVGNVAPLELGRILAASDLHIYLTAPFVLSWSMMDALSCGAVVLASATSPVKEMIGDGENGLLVDFFDVEGLADKALAVLQDPGAYRPLGRAAEALITERYGLEAVLPAMLKLYEQALAGANPQPPPTFLDQPMQSPTLVPKSVATPFRK